MYRYLTEMIAMKDKLRNLLETAGWHPQRAVELRTNEWLAEADKYGYSLNKPALKILSEFGDLLIVPNVRGKKVQPSTVHMDPTVLFCNEDKEVINLYEENLGISLSIVGWVEPSGDTILVGENGSTYLHGILFLKAGDNFLDALESILFGYKMKFFDLDDLDWFRC